MRPTLNMLSIAFAVFAAYALMRGLWLDSLSGLPIAVRGILAVGVLTLGIFGYVAGRETPMNAVAADSPRKRGWPDHLTAAGALIAIHAAFLWLLGAAPPQIERVGIAIEPWLRPELAAKRTELAAAAENDARPGNWLWQDRRSRSLSRRGTLRPGSRPEVFLRFATPEDQTAVVGDSAYLSSFALAKYTGGRWSTIADSPLPVEVGEDGFSFFSAPIARSAFGLIQHEVFHGNNAAGQNVLVALQGVESAEIAPLETYDDGFVMLPSPLEDAAGFQYRATSRPLSLGDLPADLQVSSVTDSMEASLLEIPQNPRIANHLRDQAEAIVGDTPTVRSLLELETWMREAFDYSLETTNPENLDPLENFLFSERRGHCEHFAMTAALMLRSIGIPTRIAYGWAGGTWYEAPALMVFRSRDAHAWTEVWLADYGWVVMDPTPPSGIAGTRARVAPPDEKPPDPMETTTEIEEAIDATRIDLTGAWLLGVFGLPTLVLLLLRKRLKRGLNRVDHTGKPIGISSSDYLEAWHSACPPRHPGETLRQQILRHESTPPFADDLIDYHYRVRYAQADGDSTAERELMRAIRKWTKKQIPPT